MDGKKIPKKLREHARLHVMYLVQSRASPSKDGRKLRADFERITLQQIYFQLWFLMTHDRIQIFQS